MVSCLDLVFLFKDILYCYLTVLSVMWYCYVSRNEIIYLKPTILIVLPCFGQAFYVQFIHRDFSRGTVYA